MVVHPGSAVVLPVFPDGRILLIRQYRHAAGEYLWELVAGHKEPNETFAEGAKRELIEETGYTAKSVRRLLAIFPSPGLLSERMEIFLATGLTKGAAHPEADEKITSRILTLHEAEQWIRTGKIRDAKSVSGILFYARFAIERDERWERRTPRSKLTGRKLKTPWSTGKVSPVFSALLCVLCVECSLQVAPQRATS